MVPSRRARTAGAVGEVDLTGTSAKVTPSGAALRKPGGSQGFRTGRGSTAFGCAELRAADDGAVGGNAEDGVSPCPTGADFCEDL